MALSGRINGTVGHFSQFFSFYLLWSATQDPVANTSTITATTYWSTTDRGQDFDTVGTRTAYITIAGNQTSISKRFDVSPWPTNAIYEIQTKTYTVSHDADGTKSVSISAYADGTASSYGPNECSLSGTITLDAIDRTAPEITLSLASRTATSLSISATATASCDLWEYTLDGGTTWTSFSTTDATAATCTLTGLNPGQSYTVQIRGQKTYNHLVGTSSASTYTTLGAATLNSVGEFYADASTVSINLSTEVYNASYTYSLDIKNGSTNYLSITGITAKPVGTQNFTITLTSAQRTTLLNAMANVASFSATFVLTTLNNGTTIGTSSATANIKTTTSSAPTQPTFSFKDSNASTVAVTGDNTKLIQGQSTLQITSLSATAKNGASIASYTIVVGGVTVTANAGGTVNVGAVSQSGTLSCRITAKDTRGYTSTATQNITCYPYAVPNVSSSAIARDDIDTTHIILNFSGTFSTVGSNTVTAKYKYKKTSAGSYSADTSITLTKSGGTFNFSNSHLVDFDQDDSYDFVLTISDSLNDEVYYYTVPSYSPLIAYRRDSLGINRVPRSGYAVDVHGVVGLDDVTLPDATHADEVLGMKSDGTGLEWKSVPSSASLASVAYSGDYDDLDNKPTIPPTASDYVVEQGTAAAGSGSTDSGTWTYRKWDSGIAECWATFSHTITAWQSWGYAYEGTPYAQYAYPTGFFNELPQFFVNIVSPSLGIMGNELYLAPTKDMMPRFYPLRSASSSSSVTLSFYIYAIGKWK